MAALYPHIKHLHWLLVIISVMGFNFRFGWRCWRPHRVLSPCWRIATHLNDTLLLGTGAIMAIWAGFSPFTSAKWLGIKLLLVIMYIVMGILCFRAPVRSQTAYFFYGLAMMCVVAIVWFAHCKGAWACTFWAHWI